MNTKFNPAKYTQDTLTMRKTQRFLYLKYLYEITEGDPLKLIHHLGVGKELGFDEKTTNAIIAYLRDERLIKTVTATTVSITHLGVVAIEQALNHPNTSTEYFPPANTIIVISGDVSVGGDFVARDKTVSTE